MRIVHLLKHARHADSDVETVVDLACQQARLGHEVLFVAGAGHFRQVLARHGVTFIEVPDDSAWRTMPLLRELAFVLRRTRPDIVHAHMAAGAFLAWLLRPLGGYRLITTLHHPAGRWSRLMGLGDRVVVVSEAAARVMREKGIADHRLRVVNAARHPADPQEATPLQRPAIVALAEGIETLIDAFARLRDAGTQAHLYIMGAATQALETSAAVSGHQAAIHLMGAMADPRHVLAGADVFVLGASLEPSTLAQSLQAVIGERPPWPSTDASAERMARETIDIYQEARAVGRRAQDIPLPQGALPQ